MKKIGRQVLFIGTSENNPRNGEGAFIQLSGGGIMYAFTEYVGDSWSDDASANISAVVSYDCGETWTDRRVLLYRRSVKFHERFACEYAERGYRPFLFEKRQEKRRMYHVSCAK